MQLAPLRPTSVAGLRVVQRSIFDEFRRVDKIATPRGGTPWHEVSTGESWNYSMPHRGTGSELGCEGLRHLVGRPSFPGKHPVGHPLERKLMSQAHKPRTPRGLRTSPLMAYGVHCPEPHKYYLATARGRSHDPLYQKSSMPVDASILATM